MKRHDGFSLIELLLVVAIMLLLAALLFPMLAAARRSAKESAAIGSLKALAEGELAYSSRNGQRFAGSLSTLAGANYIDSRFSTAGAINGYQYTNGNTVGASIPAGVPTTAPDGFAYSAAPNSVNDGDYDFAVGANGVVYYGASNGGKPVGQ